MNNLAFKARTAAANTAVSVIDVAGSLDLNSVDEFEATLLELFQKNRFKIVINIEKLSYISSAGVGVLVGNIKEVRKKKGDIKIAGENLEFHKVVELLDLDRLFPLFKTEDEASRSF